MCINLRLDSWIGKKENPIDATNLMNVRGLIICYLLSAYFYLVSGITNSFGFPCVSGLDAGFSFFSQIAFQSSISAANSVQYFDVTEAAGIKFKHVNGWTGKRYFIETMRPGVAFLDYDSDGYLDIYFVNGAELPGATYDVEEVAKTLQRRELSLTK